MTAAPFAAALNCLRRAVEGRSDCQLLDAYSAANDQAAFAALVKRHGPMVLGVCRRVLHDAHDAEDAFQAAFLVLARKSATLRNGEALTSWLHGVAYRVALRAQRDIARRRKHESRATPRSNPPGWEVGWRELQGILDEEVQRLPPGARAAFVSCCLEGLSLAEAAQRLGIKENTVSSQLARARQRLRGRLARRGISLTAVLAALAISGAGRAAVPPPLVRTTAEGAFRLGAGAPVTGLSARARTLAEGVTTTTTMRSNKVRLAIVLLMLSVVGTGLGVSRPAPAGPTPRAVARAVPAAPQTPAKPEDKAVKGRVLGPDGRPVPGAKLYLTPAGGYLKQPYPSPEYATTGADGRFAFTVPQAEFGTQRTVVAAAAANHGASWVEIPAGAKRDDLTLRLVKDDVPISGQIVDLEGKPVAGATLTVLQINAAPGEDLGPWLEAVKDKKRLSLPLEQEHLKRFTIALSPKVTTDAAGHFRLTGIGRNRLVRARLDGPTIASQPLQILSRPGKTLEVTESEGKPEDKDPRRVTTYYAANFRHVAAPTRPIVGVVRDKDTKKPLPGIAIRSYARAINPSSFRVVDTIVRTTTDAQGRYRLVGMPKGAGYKIAAIPGSDQPYVVTNKDVPDSPGLDPVTVDVELKRGIWIGGKITDKGTGKPLLGAVQYFSLYANPNLRDYPGFNGTFVIDNLGVGTKADGSYRVVGLPGPGLVAVWSKDHYLRAPEREDEYGIKEPSLNTSPYAVVNPSNYSALARIDPVKGVDSVKRDVTLDPAWTFTGTVLGPDGKPLAGARGFGLTGQHWWGHERMKTAAFSVWGFNPRRPRDVFFRHPEKGLIGVAQAPKENGGSVRVRMEPGAAVTGRLVDADGKPRARVELKVAFRPKHRPGWYDYSPERIETDREGRFRIGALLPGYEFRLADGKGELRLGALRLGQTRDLGSVRVKPIK